MTRSRVRRGPRTLDRVIGLLREQRVEVPVRRGDGFGTGCVRRVSLHPDLRLADPLEVVRRAPDIIIGSWCGKKFRGERVAEREGWQDVPAVRNGELHEVKSAHILQPGPAALTDGVTELHRIITGWHERRAGRGGSAEVG